jgi:hypothetical protein
MRSENDHERMDLEGGGQDIRTFQITGNVDFVLGL